MKHLFFFLFSVGWLLSITSLAQKEADVHGQYTFVVGENDNITLSEAKHRCIALAKAEAIKSVFGELVTSSTIDDFREVTGKSSSVFWQNTVALAKGDWLGDKQEPVIKVSYSEGQLKFTAEVWGIAREIVQSKVDLNWSVLTSNGRETIDFKNGDRIFVKFFSPAADGYVSIYLNNFSDDMTSCLLPYRTNTTGRHSVKRNKEILFFDKEKDPDATNYKLTTQQEIENNELVVIYSPNPFIKCTDITGDEKHPNWLSTHDFQKWLLNCQRADKDMVVEKKRIRIHKS